MAEFVEHSAGNWFCTNYSRTNGLPLAFLDEDSMASNSAVDTVSQQSLVAYVAAEIATEIAAAITGLGFGTRVYRTIGTTYQAATDGHVNGMAALNNGETIQGISDSSATPTTLLDVDGNQNASAVTTGVSFAVKKNDYYKVTTDGTASNMYFIPSGQ